MKRRHFINTIFKSTLALSLTPQLVWAEKKSLNKEFTKITILHTNDQHSRIEPFDSNDNINANKGGFARRATLLQQIRHQEKNVLLFDAGDIFQGTPYFNFFGGELEFKLMSKMGYDAATMGNHDFDNGLEGFLKVLPNAKFPFICSNYNFSNTILDGKTVPYKIFRKEGIKIGVFGLGVDLKTLVGKKQYLETKYLNPLEIAQHYANTLKDEKKCNLIICLSHLGYDYRDPSKISDRRIAAETKNIDLIIGGHTHTLLSEPQTVYNTIKKPVIINQVGFAGLMLGRIDFYFDKKNHIQQISWNNRTIDESIIT